MDDTSDPECGKEGVHSYLIFSAVVGSYEEFRETTSETASQQKKLLSSGGCEHFLQVVKAGGSIVRQVVHVLLA